MRGEKFAMAKSKRVAISRRRALQMGLTASVALAIGVVPAKLLLAETNQDSLPNTKQLGFMHNQQKCVGCRLCQAACKKTNNWEEGVEWRRVLTSQKGKTYLSISCNHCEKPACVQVCPVKAYTKREKDGIVIHDPEKCVGCKYCMYACPYHAPQFSKATGRITKCHFCYLRQDNGEKPACVANCPVCALSYGNITDLRKTKDGVAQLEGMPNPELTRPSLVIIPKA